MLDELFKEMSTKLFAAELVLTSNFCHSLVNVKVVAAASDISSSNKLDVPAFAQQVNT